MALADDVARMNEKWRSRARRYWFAACIMCTLLTTFIVLGTMHGGAGFLVSAALSMIGALGVSDAPVFEGPRLVRKGLLVAPRKPASVRLEADHIVLLDDGDELRVPLAAVHGATLVCDDSIYMDDVPGIDDALRIHLTASADLIIGSSTEGFRAMTTWLARRKSVITAGTIRRGPTIS